MGIKGAAIATLISQLFNLIFIVIGFILCIRKMEINRYCLYTLKKSQSGIINIVGTWCIGIPLCLLAAYVFKWGIVGVYTLLTTEELFRLAVSLIIFRKRKWIISLC